MLYKIKILSELILSTYPSHRSVVQNYHLFHMEHIHLVLWKFQRITQAELKLVLCHSFPVCQMCRMKDDWQIVWPVNPSIKHSSIWKDRYCDDQHSHVLCFLTNKYWKVLKVINIQHSYKILFEILNLESYTKK